MEPMPFNARKDEPEINDAFGNGDWDGEVLGNSDLCLSKSISKGLNKSIVLPHLLYLKLKQYQCSKRVVHDSFFKGLEYKVPKYMVTIDEKYVRRCLELIQISASKSARCNVSVNSSFERIGALSDSLNMPKLRSTGVGDLDRFVVTCPSMVDDGNTVISPSNMWFIGSIMGSKSMINILKSPLLHQLGISDDTSNLVGMDFNDIKGFTGCDFSNSHDGLDISSLKRVENTVLRKGSHRDGSDTINEMLFSTPSRNSLCSDQSSLGSASTPFCQGMLQFTWKEGNPHFVFSVDDEKEVYVANSWKVKSVANKDLDCVYLFHSATSGAKDRGVSNTESNVVGKMKVSTSFSLSPNNSKVVDTEFVLFGAIGNSDIEAHPSNNSIKKNKAFPRKVAEVFRPRHSSKQISMSNFSRSGTTNDSCPWEPYSDKRNIIDGSICSKPLHLDLPTNLELAAIIVRDYLPNDRGKRVGGWGLKFLKQIESKQPNDSQETAAQAGCCARNSGICSTSMDILIPAGFHGGPRMKNGGPSSLIERWKSGGRCDCGGWDMGCPLTILNGQSTNREILPQTETQECRAFTIHTQGLENNPPALRIVNIRDGLYFVHFQPKLSPLQSFSIATAILHSRTPTLRPRNVQDVK